MTPTTRVTTFKTTTTVLKTFPAYDLLKENTKETIKLKSNHKKTKNYWKNKAKNMRKKNKKLEDKIAKMSADYARFRAVMRAQRVFFDQIGR